MCVPGTNAWSIWTTNGGACESSTTDEGRILEQRIRSRLHVLCVGLRVRVRLNAIQLGVLPLLRKQFVVRADFDEMRAIEDDDQIRHPHGRESMRYQNG